MTHFPSLLVFALFFPLACSSSEQHSADRATGGENAAGSGSILGGAPAGGALVSAGAENGGSTATGGAGQGGTATGGRLVSAGAGNGGSAATGGASQGGTATGGTATGGAFVSAGAGNGGSTATGGASQGGAATGGTATGGTETTVRLPPENGQFDYQIGGAYTPPEGVVVVSRDREDNPAPDLYNICYVNGFQGQPGDESWWLDQHADLVLHDSNGDPIYDEGWGELILDVTTAAKREALAVIVGGWIEQCAADGFDAVEIDNLDTHSRSDGLIAPSDNVQFMALLSPIAHQAGLAIAQKNSVELLDDADVMGTDFAIAEECARWNECSDYQSVYGNLVFDIEYRDQDFEAACSDYSELSIVRRDVDVTAPGSASYVYDAC